VYREQRKLGLAAKAIAVSLLALLPAGTLFMTPKAVAQDTSAHKATSPVHVGTLTRFWRNRPVIGRWLIYGQGLAEVPDYLCDPKLSFPYRKRPYPKEVMFADHLTVVRLLGGWKYMKGKGELNGGPRADLAYRDENGKIRYRWDLLAPRLDQYVKNGYELTIVLDNTPYCFPNETFEGAHYGNSAPPADFQEWGDFVAELCRQLVKLYGHDTVSKWRFRMGTECQGTARFTGPQEEYFKLYDYAAAGVKSVIPEAGFGPFNLAGGPTTGNVVYYELADHCTTGTNYATGETGSPLDFASVSIYKSPSILRGLLRTADPDFKAQQKVDFRRDLRARHPKLKDVPAEVHEFGILANEFGVGNGEPGAQGAAWIFHIMMNLFAGNIDSMWHWGGIETIWTDDETYHLPQAEAWLYGVLEHAAGGEAYVLTPKVEKLGVLPTSDPDLRAIASFERTDRLAREYETFRKSVAFVHDDRTYIITSAYNEDRFVTATDGISLEIPTSIVRIPKDAKVSAVELNRTNAPYFQIRKDFEKAGILKDGFRKVPGLLSGTMSMGGRTGRDYIVKHWPRYVKLVQDSLMLKPFGGEVRSYATKNHITFRMAPPSVMVVVIEGTERGAE